MSIKPPTKKEFKGVITLDPGNWFPKAETMCAIDLKEALFKGLIVKEAEFRVWCDQHNWEQYSSKHVAIFCSTEAIIPMWAYMLIASHLQPFTNSIHYKRKENLEQYLLLEHIRNMSIEEYRDARVIIKGCGEKNIEPQAYILLTSRLVEVARTVQFGEPCSTVPVFKREMT